MAQHYANAFSFDPGRCFRMVQLPGVGHPMHCPEPVTTHGRWRSAADQLYRVDACDGHKGELVAPTLSVATSGPMMPDSR